MKEMLCIFFLNFGGRCPLIIKIDVPTMQQIKSQIVCGLCGQNSLHAALEAASHKAKGVIGRLRRQTSPSDAL